MIKPIRNIIAVYTTVSIIMSILFPIGIHATDTGVTDNGSNIVFSGSEVLSGAIITNSTGNIVSDSGIIDSIPLVIDNGSGSNSTRSTITESGNISSISTGVILIEGIGTENSIVDSGAQSSINTGSLVIAQEDEIHEEKNHEAIQMSHPEIEILVQFKGSIENTMGEYQVNQIESIHNLKTTDTIPENNITVMTSTMPEMINSVVSETTNSYEESPQEKNIENIINELKDDPRIAHVQKNFVYTTQSVDDPNYSNLWALNNEGQNVNGLSGTIDADIDYPEAMMYASGKLGTGIIVAVLDTGIAYNHPDLIGHMWDGTNCLSDTGATLGGCVYGYDFVNSDTKPNDGHSHGTHVAGTIGAITNNTTGIAGVSPNVALMAIKILNDKGGGSTATIIRGINFAKHNGARVINASFGGIDEISTSADFDFLTYNAIRDFPGLFIAAAGNDGNNLENMPGFKNFPSGFGSDTMIVGEATIPRLSNVIAVAASDQNDNLASFSNYGTGTVHMAAPGTNIYSTIPIQNIIPGIIDTISYSNNWNKQVQTSTGSFETRTGVIISTPSINLSGALWGDINTPYLSGKTDYIEKNFSNINGSIGNISLNIWCDTPSSNFYTDYIEVLVNTGGTYQSIKKIDEDIIIFDPTSQSLTIDGHIGHYTRYNIKNGNLGSFQNGNLGIRLRWHSDSIDDLENGIPHYGCAIENLSIDTVTETYGYGFKNGTSMATPHVVGAAALAWSYKSNASIQEIRDSIINGRDVKNSLLSKVQTGGRLNILGMLQLLIIPPVVIIPPVINPPSCSLSINPNNINNGSGTILTWSMSGSLTGTLNPGNITLGSSGSLIITPPPSATTPYVLLVMNSGGTSSCTGSVTTTAPVVIPPVVVPPVTPPTCTLSLSPNSVTNGSGTILSWSMSRSLSGTLNPGNILLGTSGSMIIIPPSSATTPYTLVVNNSAGSGSCSATVTSAPIVVVQPVTPPVVIVPPINPPIVSGGSITGPGGGGRGGTQVNNTPIQNTKLQEPVDTNHDVTISEQSLIQGTNKTLGKISSLGRILNIQIRKLQKKLNNTINEGYIARREIILNLQDLYRSQIKLMQESYRS